MDFLNAQKNKFISYFVVIILAFSVIMPIKVSAISSISYSGTDVSGEVFDVIPLSGVSLSGDDPTVPVNLSVDGDGILSMTTTTGLTFSGSSTGSNINFEGTITDINNALATLQYRSDKAETVTFTATIANPGEVYYPGNGHMYEIVDNGSGISWNDAKIAAEGLSKNGADGYLATVTTQGEFDYISPRLSGSGWFGASDATTEGDWQWATGPETGTSFWAGLGDGSPVGGLFSNWSGGEPNDSGGDEDCAEFYAGGSGWNDLPCNGPWLNYFVVEYGAPGDLPTAPSSIDFEITTTEPAAQTIVIDSCLDVLDLSTNQNDHRFDNISMSTDIDCNGETVSPLFDFDDPDFGFIGFRGTFDGNSHTISNFEVSTPSNTSVGLFAATNGASISNLNFNGAIAGDYCIGSIVGDAADTSIDNVHSNTAILANYEAGGLVGCFQASDDDSSLTDSSYSGSIVADESVGGIIGEVDTDLDNVFTVTDNDFSGSINVNSYGYNVAGIIGEADADDDSSIVVSNNSTVGISIPNSDGLGGIFGDADADEGSTIDIFENTISGDFEGEYNVGSVVGEAEATDGSVVDIHDMTINNNVSAYQGAGGIAGDLYTEGYNDDDGTAINLYSLAVNGNVDGSYRLGGMIGEASTDRDTDTLSIVDSFVEGDIMGDDAYIGGLIGDSEGAHIESSYYNGNVSNTGNGDDTGGLVGYADETTITESSSEGTVSSVGGQRIGGLVGRNASDSTISESYSTSDVVASSSSKVGGLVGANGSDGIIEDSYARGDVTGDDNVGGLVGRCGGEIYRSYATGAVSGGSDTGGLLGYEDGCDSTDSFWDAQTSGQSTSVLGTSKTTSEMKAYATFTDLDSTGLDNPWEFGDIWGMNTLVNDGYPCLLWQDNACEFDNSDSDGIPNNVEAAAPNSGDANNDGTPDNEQSNVASFVNDMTNEYVSLEAPDGCEITSASILDESSNPVDDAGFDYSSGLVNFSADCGTPGYTADVKIFIYGVSDESLILRKYNPNNDAYFTISSATIDKSTVDSKDVMIVNYQIVDGEELDIDGLENGIIEDPAGLAKSIVGSPNTGIKSLY